MPYTRVRFPADWDLAAALRERIPAFNTEQHARAGRFTPVYFYESSNYADVWHTALEDYHMLVKQIKAEATRIKTAAPKMTRTKTAGVDRPSVPVKNIQALERFIPRMSLVTSQTYRLIEQSLATNMRSMQVIEHELSAMREIVHSGGLILHQESMIEEPAIPTSCAGPWQDWANSRSAKVIRPRQKKPQLIFEISKQAAQMTAENMEYRYHQYEVAVHSLRNQLQALPITTNPQDWLSESLSGIRGYEYFECDSYGAIRGHAQPATISGIEMGSYCIKIVPPSKDIEISGGRYLVDGKNHPHVAYGRP
jgi:hypothetical protein